MPKYSVPRQIWRVIYPTLIFIAIPLVFNVMAGAIYGISLVFSNGGTMPDTATIMEQAQQWALDYGLLFVFIGDLLCLAPFLPIWTRTRKKMQMYEGASSALKTTICVLFTFFGFSIILGAIISITGFDKLFSYELVETILASGNTVFRILSLLIAAPLIEELCFRGIVLNRLLSWTKIWVAIIIQAALFGLAHLNVVQGVYAFVVGVAMGFIYCRYRKLWLCMVAHFAFNLPSLVFEFIDVGDSDITAVGWIIIGAGAVIAIACAFFLSRLPAATPVAKEREVLLTDEQIVDSGDETLLPPTP